MRYRVAALEGEHLDRAVAMAEGLTWSLNKSEPSTYSTLQPFSTSWAHGGPIIEREHLNSYFTGFRYEGDAGEWECPVSGLNKECIDWKLFYQGKTMLVASMRAYVASKFGDEIEL